MSARIMKWVTDHSQVKGAAGRLLWHMAWRVHDDGEFWAKNETLARELKCDVRTVQRLTKALVAAGAIEKVTQTSPDKSGRQINNLYRVLTPGFEISNPRPRPGKDLRLVASAEEGRVTKLSPSPPDKTVTLPLTKTSPSPRQNCHPPKEETTLQTSTSNHNDSAASARARVAAPEAAQGRLPLIGAVPQPKSPPATFEDQENLRADIEELVEITGHPFERWLERVSDGSAPPPRVQMPGGFSLPLPVAANARLRRVPPAVRIEGMTADRVFRCRRDARLWREELRRHYSDEHLAAADQRAQARRTA